MLEQDYRILRVDRDADHESIRRSYIKLSRRYHPEHFPEKFKQIKGAFDRLNLDPAALGHITKEISNAKNAEQISGILIQQAWQKNTGSKAGEDLQLDVMTLEPVLNVQTIRQKIMQQVEDIEKQGLQYKSSDT